MIRRADGLIVPVRNAFWPALFTSPLITKFCGQSIVFCLNDKGLKTQVLFVYPEEGYSELPGIRDLLDLFSMEEKGSWFHGPNDLPMPFHELRNIAGVEVDSLSLPDRTVHVLTPMWLPIGEDVHMADSIFTSVYFQAVKVDLDQLIACSDEHLLLHLEKCGAENYKAVALVRNNAVARLAPHVQIITTSDGDVTVNDFVTAPGFKD